MSKKRKILIISSILLVVFIIVGSIIFITHKNEEKTFLREIDYNREKEKKHKTFTTSYNECADLKTFAMTYQDNSYIIVECNGKKYIQFYNKMEYDLTPVYGINNIKKTYENGVLNITYDWVYSDYTDSGCVLVSDYCNVYFTIEVDDNLKEVCVNNMQYSQFTDGYVKYLNEDYKPIDVNTENVITKDNKIYHICYLKDKTNEDIYRLIDDNNNVIFETPITMYYNNEYIGNYSKDMCTKPIIYYNNTFICNTYDGVVKIDSNGNIIQSLSDYNTYALIKDLYNDYRTDDTGYFIVKYSPNKQANSELIGLIDKDFNIILLPDEYTDIYIDIENKTNIIVSKEFLITDNNGNQKSKKCYAHFSEKGEQLCDFPHNTFDSALEYCSYQHK